MSYWYRRCDGDTADIKPRSLYSSGTVCIEATRNDSAVAYKSQWGLAAIACFFQNASLFRRELRPRINTGCDELLSPSWLPSVTKSECGSCKSSAKNEADRTAYLAGNSISKVPSELHSSQAEESDFPRSRDRDGESTANSRPRCDPVR